MAWTSEQSADRIGKTLPDRTLFGKCVSSAFCQGVDATPPSRLRCRPLAAEQSRLFEPMECWVNRTLRQLECAATTTMYLLNYRIAVRRSPRQRSEHDHVEVPFKHFAFHGGKRYP